MIPGLGTARRSITPARKSVRLSSPPVRFVRLDSLTCVIFSVAEVIPGHPTMIFDRTYEGPQGVTASDRQYAGSRFSEVRAALFANAYYRTWGGPGESPLPTYEVSLGRALRGILPSLSRWPFFQAAHRTIESQADLRWGPDGRGFRRIVHPNGVCLTGTWEIDEAPDGPAYTGYFKPGSRALIIGRYSTGSYTQSEHYRSLALVGKLYPTTDPDHTQPYRTANFVTQEDLGGAWSPRINDAEVRNAPDVTPWRRGRAFPILMATTLALRLADKQVTIRQLYPIAELGKPDDVPTKAPEFMRLMVPKNQERVPGDHIDFRDEILAQIYDKDDDKPKRTLTFNIEVSDEGTTKGLLRQRRFIKNWKHIGRIVFKDAVASYNGDFVIHFHHPPWREDRNDPSTVTGPQLGGR
jgi:hypothetical protein